MAALSSGAYVVARVGGDRVHRPKDPEHFGPLNALSFVLITFMQQDYGYSARVEVVLYVQPLAPSGLPGDLFFSPNWAILDYFWSFTANLHIKKALGPLCRVGLTRTVFGVGCATTHSGFLKPSWQP